MSFWMSSPVKTRCTPGKFARRLRVDADDAPMRHGAAEHFAMQHARQAQMMRVVGAAGDLGADFKAGNVSADLVHHATCRVSWPSARRTARRR